MSNKSFCLTAIAACLALSPALAKADNAPAPPSPPPMPSMVGPLAGNSDPYTYDAGAALGKVTVTGAATVLGLTQNNAVANDRNARADIGNGQLFIQNTTGPVQFFLQAGTYSIPALGTAHLRADKTVDETYGFLPQGFVKIVPSSSFSVEAGKLPTLFGAEYTFTFENMNVERGLLWNQENAVNRGVQANYTTGPWAWNLSVNDGFYSDRLSWLDGAVTYTINSTDTLEAVAGGNLKRTSYSSLATPTAQNDSSIYNLIYTHTNGPWIVEPYLQYTYVPEDVAAGIRHAASTYGAAVLAKYSFNPNFSLAGRAEYIGSSGSVANGAPNLLYGPGSKAMSLTLTPTYQYKEYFGRVDASYVHATDTQAGSAFGTAGTNASQGRLVAEAGILF
jgi:hypothetical protein